MLYSSAGLLSITILLIINFDVFRKPKYGEAIRAQFAYRSFLFSVMNYYVTDILWGLFYSTKYVVLTYVDTVFYFSAMVMSVFFWIQYIIHYINVKKKFFTVLRYAGILFILSNFIILIINLFTPVMFSFDAKGIYTAGPARHVLMTIQVLLFLAISIYIASITMKTDGRIKLRHRAIWLSGLAMAIFITLQIMYDLLPFYSIGFIIATCIMHSFVLEDEKEARREELEKLLMVEQIQEAELGSARKLAFTDPLTGVKNKTAYIEDVGAIEIRIVDGFLKNFAAAVFDVNGLKIVNDTKGHEAGDVFIKSACKIISHIFHHSPIYRIGGDEFVAFLTGEAYEKRQILFEMFDKKIEENKKNGGIVIAGGYSEFIPGQDSSFLRVFERADHNMYERKKQLKEE